MEGEIKNVIKELVSVENLKKHLIKGLAEFAYTKCDKKDLTIKVKYDLNINKSYKELQRILLGKTPLQLEWDIEAFVGKMQVPDSCLIFWLSFCWYECIDGEQQLKEQVLIKAE